MRVRNVLLAGAVLVCFLNGEVARACSVCFGDPESPLVKGVNAGVIIMIGFVGFVLTGVAGTGLFWRQRGRRLARDVQAEESFKGRSPH